MSFVFVAFGMMLLWQDISASTASSLVPVATAAQPTCLDMSGNVAMHLMKYVVEATGILKKAASSQHCTSCSYHC